MLAQVESNLVNMNNVFEMSKKYLIWLKSLIFQKWISQISVVGSPTFNLVPEKILMKFVSLLANLLMSFSQILTSESLPSQAGTYLRAVHISPPKSMERKKSLQEKDTIISTMVCIKAILSELGKKTTFLIQLSKRTQIGKSSRQRGGDLLFVTTIGFEKM